ncbi:vacuolar sorting protein VPS33/slp1 [Zygosaccharomyces mellis]|uniref:Vacuolar sorting protein VPS33/slp1 n=1 Tax=Zygosaccharomyces mellis TaxID=42258 RepID=A0A4C2EAM0_9SACH|nr:vacuolar sorting protein VPS33/slp1 [Zygosaccharomyces mellis]
MSDLIELQKNNLLSLLSEVQTPHNVKFLVIDAEVEKFLSYLFSNPGELLRHVTGVDRIDSPSRKGQSSVEAIYLLKPNKYNINCIDVDFRMSPPRYRRAHIRFLPGTDPQIVGYFKSKRFIPQYLASIQEVELSFIPKETQFFLTMDIDRSLQLFFNKQCMDLIDKNVKRTIHSLLNLCIVTGEYPIIRYSEPQPNQEKLTPATLLAKRVAFEFQTTLDNYARDHQDYPPPSQRPRAVCLITDRCLDLFSPVLHDFTYKSMVYDLVPDVDPATDICNYTAENEKGEQEEKTSKLLDLLDPDWVELKNQHIVDANEYLNAKIKEMIAKNPKLVDRSNVKTTTDLLSVVAHLKDFDEERRRMILHRTLIEKCLIINQERRLAESSDVEQCCAGFGTDIDGERVKNITYNLLEALSIKESNVIDKIRHIIVYALYRGGIIEQDFIKLLAFIGIEENHDFFSHFMLLFKNFDQLGFQLIKESAKNKPYKKEWFHDTIVKDSSIYNTSRFIPAIGNILAKLIANPLLVSEELFPYVKDKPIELLDEQSVEASGYSASVNSSTSLRNPRHKAAWTKNNVNQKKAPRQRFFYYIIGGVTNLEIKAIYEQSGLKNRDIFIGSDGIITPLSFLKSVENLTNDRRNLQLKDDAREKERPPEFMLAAFAAVAPPVSHAINIPKNPPPQSAPASTQSTPQSEAGAGNGRSPEKKKSKFSKLLKSKDKKK